MRQLLLLLSISISTIAWAQTLEHTYFMTTVGNTNYLNYKGDTVVFEAVPKPIKVLSMNGGKTAAIALGDNWLKVDTTESYSVVLSSSQPGSNDPTVNWVIESVSSGLGAVYTIKSTLPDTVCYLNSANYTSLNLSNQLGNGAPGCYWYFQKKSPQITINQLLHTGNFIFPPTGETTITNPDSILHFANETVNIQKRSSVYYDWNWHLDKDPNTKQPSYEIRITNLKNQQFYVIPNQNSIGSCGLDTSLYPLYSERGPNVYLQSGWLPGLIEIGPGVPIGLWNSYYPFDCHGYCPQLNGLVFSESEFKCRSSNPKAEGPVGVSQFNLAPHQQYYVGQPSSTLQATKNVDLKSIEGDIVQELNIRNLGTNKYYTYGNEKALHIVKRNPYFPNINDNATYRQKHKQPIFGASINNSYTYLINNDSLRLYSLFGMNEEARGLLKELYLGDLSQAETSAPVYNPVSHNVFLLENIGDNSYVCAYGQGLESNIPYYTDTNRLAASPLELFVVPENEVTTHLYYLTTKGSLVSLKVDAQKILSDGEPIPVTEKEIRWLRHQTKMLNYKNRVSLQNIVELKNGYAASGPIDLNSKYVLFFTQDSILGASQVTLYTGQNTAFPSFPNLTSIDTVVYNADTSLKMISWVIQNEEGNNLWTEGYPLITYDQSSNTFTVESLAKNSPLDSTSKVYSYEIPLDAPDNVAALFNLEWQNAKGNLSKLTKGSILELWYQFNWMINAHPFPK